VISRCSMQARSNQYGPTPRSMDGENPWSGNDLDETAHWQKIASLPFTSRSCEETCYCSSRPGFAPAAAGHGNR